MTRFYIWRFLRRNKGYRYEFYDDARVDAFMKEHFDERTFKAYLRLQIGAAKADFFRYAVLYIFGGVYVDLDSDIVGRLDKYIKEEDSALITVENGKLYYAQWALIFDKGHPFLKRTIDYIVDYIEQNKFTDDVHKLTGPTVYTKAIKDEIEANPHVSYRVIPNDYKGLFQFKYKLAKKLIYWDKSQHWKALQKQIPVVKPEE